MNYNFIDLKHRPFFNLLDKIWLVLFGLGVVFIFIVFLIYIAKSNFSVNRTENKKDETFLIQQKIKQNDKIYNVLLEQSQIASEHKAHNQNIKNSLQNLLDMTLKTESISLDSIEQNAHSLKLIGVSPTKEMFITLLETPLKSIFDESHTTYYKLNNGWYRFTSINSIVGAQDEQGL